MHFRMNLGVGVILAFLIVTIGNVSCSSTNHTREKRSMWDRVDITKPLTLSEDLPWFRDAGRLDVLRDRAKVHLSELENIESYAGYLTDPTYYYNHYFWYFPARETPETAPVILYIEGTMHENMFFSIFTQNGPFSVGSDGQLVARNESWHNKHHMIYMDSMPGMGFTFESGSESREMMSRTIYYSLNAVLWDFFEIFSSIRQNPFFLAGNYYAWTYLPVLATNLHRDKAWRSQNDLYINYKGIIVANGLVNIEEQVSFGNHLYTIGLIDDQGKEQFDDLEQHFASHYDQSEYEHFYNIFEQLIMGENSLFQQLTGYLHPYNILEDAVAPALIDYYSGWVNRGDVRRALHIGDQQPYQPSSQIALNNWKQPINALYYPYLNDTFDNHRVLIYTGNLDILCPYPSVERWLEKFAWTNKQEFMNAERQPWLDSSNQLAGYIKKSRNIFESVIINAGHYPCIDQPKRTLELVEDFTHGSL